MSCLYHMGRYISIMGEQEIVGPSAKSSGTFGNSSVMVSECNYGHGHLNEKNYMGKLEQNDSPLL